MCLLNKHPWTRRVPEFLIYTFAAECTFGCSGRWLCFGPLSIRIFLFILCFLATLPKVLTQFRIVFRKPVVIVTLAFGVMLLASAVIGIITKNNTSFVWQDVSRLLTFALLPGILVEMDTREKRDRLFKVIFYAAVGVATSTVGLYLLLKFVSAETAHAVNDWINARGLGGLSRLSTGTFRVYFRNQIFLQFGAVYGLWLAGNSTGKKRILFGGLVGLLVYATILSFTRGFWLGLAISVVILFVLEWRHWKKLILCGCIALFSVVLLLGITVCCYGKPYVLVEFMHRLDPSLMVSTDSSQGSNASDSSEFDDFLGDLDEEWGDGFMEDEVGVTDEANQAAVALRTETIRLSMENIRRNLLLGCGLGENLDSIRDDGKTEYTYLDMLMKLGLIGFIFFVIALFISCAEYMIYWFRNLKKKQDWESDDTRAGFMVAAYLGTAVTSIYNPFITSPMGIMMLFTVVVAMELCKKSSAESGRK